MATLPPPPRQLRALLALRWTMVRAPGVRIAIIITAVVAVWLAVAVSRSGGALTPELRSTALDIAPAAFLGFAALAIIAPLTAGGGASLVPADQLVAFPVRPMTEFLGGLTLAPVNLVWVLQLLGLVAETSYLAAGGHGWAAAATTVAFVLALMAGGQAFAWGVTGLRQSRPGRRLLAVAVGGLVVGAFVLVRLGDGHDIIDRSPTRTVVAGVRAGARGDMQRWGLTTTGLLLGAAVALALGARVCGWALRQTSDQASVRASRNVRRRPQPASALRVLVAADRASIWRAPALRRGGLVLTLLPGAAAAAAAVPWQSLAVLPGLVAAGAGLLFGINAFSLEASGAVWLASLPHDPRLQARSKLVVTAETVLGAAVIAAVAGSLRSPGTPTAAELAALVCSGLSCSALVVARCFTTSVRRPHHAELRGPRDAVAPPGALMLASTQLAVPATLLGLLFEGAGQSGSAWLPPLIALPVLAWSALRLRDGLRTWDDPVSRAHVVQVVARG